MSKKIQQINKDQFEKQNLKVDLEERELDKVFEQNKQEQLQEAVEIN